MSRFNSYYIATKTATGTMHRGLANNGMAYLISIT